MDSSRKYEQCRSLYNSTSPMYYEFFCDGDRISGKTLCEDETCAKCEIDSTMRDASGNSMFPYGEMLLDTCLRLPSDNSTWVRFDGKCPGHKGIGPIGITFIVLGSLLALVCICAGAFLWKKRRESQSRWYTSGSSTGSSSSSYRAPAFAGV